MLPTHREPTSPGDMLKYFLDEMEITQAQFAKHLGWTTTKVNQLVRDKRAITPETALCLSDAFGNSAQFWLNCQQEWELWHALRDHQQKPKIAV